MLTLPPTFERALFYQHFQCPWCGYRSGHAFIEKGGWNPFQKGFYASRCWCESCGRCSSQRFSILVGAVWGAFAGTVAAIVAFGPAAEFMTNSLGFPEWVALLVGPIVALAFWPLFSRQCSRYKRANPSHP